MFTQTSIHLLVRLLAGAPADEVDLVQLNGLRDIALAIITAEDRLSAFEAAIAERVLKSGTVDNSLRIADGGFG